MSIIVRLDIDRPFGKKNKVRQIASRIGSDLYLPKIKRLGYLEDLLLILQLLNDNEVRSFLFFRRCTLPDQQVLKVIEQGKHLVGLHLENSRSFHSFSKERALLENHIRQKVVSFSKHGSGIYKYGLFHYAPYEPQKYINWGKKSGMKIFFGNLEDPSIPNYRDQSLQVYPSAFWLEPHWRDTNKYTVEWLIENASRWNIVLLFHPDNVTVDPLLWDHLVTIIKNAPTKVLD